MIVLLVKFLESIIIILKLNMISVTKHVTNDIRPNKPWLHFLKPPYGYLHMVISFLNLLEQCNLFHFYNVVRAFYIFIFSYVMSYDMISIWNSIVMALPKLYHKFFDSYYKPILLGFPGDKSPTIRFIIFIHSNPEFGRLVQGFS